MGMPGRSVESHAPSSFVPATKWQALNPYRSPVPRAGEVWRPCQFAIFPSFLEGFRGVSGALPTAA